MSSRPWNDAARFLATFVRNPRSVGAVLPSSPALARVLAGGLDLVAGDVVVEYGPGTGPITKAIEPQLVEGASYLGIERDPGFHMRLTARYAKLAFHLGSVEDVAEVLEQHGLARPRYIISGLPFASLPGDVQHNVIEATRRVLRPDGEFRTFQYVHAWNMAAARRFRSEMRQKFAHEERSKAVIANVPPAYVLTYRD